MVTCYPYPFFDVVNNVELCHRAGGSNFSILTKGLQLRQLGTCYSFSRIQAECSYPHPVCSTHQWWAIRHPQGQLELSKDLHLLSGFKLSTKTSAALNVFSDVHVPATPVESFLYTKLSSQERHVLQFSCAVRYRNIRDASSAVNGICKSTHRYVFHVGANSWMNGCHLKIASRNQADSW